MKSITVYFEDNEFEELKDIKDTMSWHDFIMQLTEKNNENMEEKNSGKKTN